MLIEDCTHTIETEYQRQDGTGANFCMEQGKTALTEETPEDVVQCLSPLEDEISRNTLVQNGYNYISQYFPEEKPAQFW